jgi:hypothetical protein
MPNTRVIYISDIVVGSKFRTIAVNTAKVKAAKKLGTSWSSCKLNDTGGNLQRPSFQSGIPLRARTSFNPAFGWIKVYPPKFNIFNRPCPRAINYKFGNVDNGQGFSLIP